MLRSMERVALALWCSWAVSAGAADAPPTVATGEDLGALLALGHDLTLVVSEDGPDQPWTLSLTNQGDQPIGLIADPGLLWFEVSLPGREPQSCRLPEPLRPAAMQRKSVLELHPGEHFSRRFDPRFFCFAELGQLLLVPGARVTPHFGWPREAPVAKTKKPAKGKATAAPSTSPLEAPFVAWRWTAAAQAPTSTGTAGAAPAPEAVPENKGTESEEEDASSKPATGSPWRWPTEGLKSLQGATLELPASYASWVGAPRRDAPRDLELVLIAGSDAEDERNATVSFGLVNPLDRAQQIFVRRELLDYDVQGPDGFFQCPGSDVGSPDFASFTTLRPHAAERLMVRLIEVCPRRSFARPGLYEVRARLAAKWSGQDLGLDAFVGQLEATHPAFVRVRSGDRSSFARLVVAAGGSAGAVAGEGDAPLDVTPNSVTPNSIGPDDVPADHDMPGTPDEAPAPPPDPVPPPVE
ncbi:MAG TPA: hypothetical protein VJU61_20090 [Polyangiaceae bacterium]|nr:hypothetical protein [Polyangiaceae bacterium]